jgi:hypothetical protein
VAINPNPFAIVDRQTVIGSLKAIGSHDPDVLYAEKTLLRSAVRFPRIAGTLLILLGVLVSLTRVGRLIAIPLVLAGWWFRRRGNRNLAAVESGFAEFVDSSGA